MVEHRPVVACANAKPRARSQRRSQRRGQRAAPATMEAPPCRMPLSALDLINMSIAQLEEEAENAEARRVAVFLPAAQRGRVGAVHQGVVAAQRRHRTSASKAPQAGLFASAAHSHTDGNIQRAAPARYFAEQLEQRHV